MGGGFSAIALALVRDEAAAEFKKSLSRAYTEKFKGTLGFIEFTPSEGAEIVYG
jgi:galactokinase